MQNPALANYATATLLASSKGLGCSLDIVAWLTPYVRARSACVVPSVSRDLQWHQIELSEARLHVHRVKNGTPSIHPIRGDEMRALHKLRRDNPTDAYVFVSERGGPMSPIGFHRLEHFTIRLTISGVGEVCRRAAQVYRNLANNWLE
jgi:hypothetical protein